MKKYLLTIAYDGKAYSGWQRQELQPSIQSLIESALSTLLQTPTLIEGSGRTDAGVHALGQTAHFSCNRPINKKRILLSLNALLQKDIRILKLSEVPKTFHARYSASGKIYRYHLYVHPILPPFRHGFVTHIPYPLDRERLKKGCEQFIGTHNFSSFANRQHQGSAGKNAVRTIHRLEMQEKGDEIILEFEGDGFLYKMVRNIVGTLLLLATGKIKIDEIPRIFATEDRRKAGQAAPPEGLFLVSVIYPDEEFLQKSEIEEREPPLLVER